MYKLLLVIFLGSLIFSVENVHAQERPLTTVDHVDLQNYTGKWYEIASIPQYFQRKCISDTTAEYEFINKDSLRVLNSCMTANHTRIYSEGRAKVVDSLTNAKLKVTFANLGETYFYTLGGKYWIIDLDPDYNFAIVGHPKRTYGWILSRSPAVTEHALMELSIILMAKGYDTCKFVITPQTGGYTTKGPLCKVVTPNSIETAF
jgi:apolipoprotein D and lipocalin family protein